MYEALSPPLYPRQSEWEFVLPDPRFTNLICSIYAHWSIHVIYYTFLWSPARWVEYLLIYHECEIYTNHCRIRSVLTETMFLQLDLWHLDWFIQFVTHYSQPWQSPPCLPIECDIHHLSVVLSLWCHRRSSDDLVVDLGRTPVVHAGNEKPGGDVQW